MKPDKRQLATLKERWVQKDAERKVQVEQARKEWLGCRVHFKSSLRQPGYACVVEIDDRGFVTLLFECRTPGSPSRSKVLLSSLGTSVTHAS